MDIADRLDRIQASGIREIFDRAANLDEPINLSIGQPSFDVPDGVKQQAKQAIDQGKNQYTGTRGLPRLRKRIREDVAERTDVEPDANLVTAGVSGGLVLALMALVNRGDEVLVPDPYFVSYKQLTHLVEADPVMMNTYPDFKLTPEQLEKKITRQSSVLLFNNPGNPTGVAYEEEEVRAIAEVCRAHDLTIISDEIYTHFTYDHAHHSMLTEAPERTILLEGASKTYGMPGWRVGWACGPDRVIDQMATLQQFSFVCAHAPSQHAVISALDHDMQEEVTAYRRRRDLLCEGLDDRYEFATPGGAFYLFPEVPGELSGREFVERAMERDVMIVHGSVFSEQDSHFRISYAVDEEVLQEGIDRLNAIADEVTG
jgi:aspartate aminotransferase/aminotransferase